MIVLALSTNGERTSLSNKITESIKISILDKLRFYSYLKSKYKLQVYSTVTIVGNIVLYT